MTHFRGEGSNGRPEGSSAIPAPQVSRQEKAENDYARSWDPGHCSSRRRTSDFRPPGAGLESRRDGLHALSGENSEVVLRTFVDAFPDPVVLLDRDLTVLMANHRLIESLGLTSREVLGRSVPALLGPEGTRRVEFVRRAIREGEPQRFEDSRAGRRFRNRVFPIRDDAGQVVQVAVIAVDVTESWRAQRLMEREKLFANTMIQTLPGIFYVLDREGRLIQWNRTAEETSGLGPGRLVGADALLAIHKQDRPMVARQLRRALETGEASVEARIRSRNGPPRHFFLTARRMEVDGTFFLVGNGIDLTERKKAETALAESERLLREVIESRSEGLLVTDRNGHVIFMNQGAKDLIGPIGPEMDRMEWARQAGIHRPDRSSRLPTEEMATSRALRGESTNRIELFLQNATVPEGRWIRASGRPLKDPSGQVSRCVVVLEDTTEQKFLGQKLADSRRMESLGTMAGGVAHDFNNILYAMLGFTDLALDLVDPDSKAHGCLEQIRDGGKRAADLVKQILAFSRSVERDKEPLRMQAVLAEALQLIRGSLPAMIEVKAEIDEGCRTVLADATALLQIIMNLCSNAFRAMSERGGRLEIGLTETAVGPEAVELGLDLPAGDYIRLSVRDNGCGMDASTRERIFEPYFTTRKFGEGTGLGLAIAGGLVRAMEGGITVESEPGTGSRFDVLLPVYGFGARSHTDATGFEARSHSDMTGSATARDKHELTGGADDATRSGSR